MSGFLLCWYRDGGAPDDALVAAVVAALRARGPEATRVLRTAHAVAVHTAFTDAIGAEEDLPLHADDVLLAADLRLDDRATLRARLRDAGHALAPDATDAALLHAAVRAWGADAPGRLLGDYAYAALRPAAGRFDAVRGTAGVKPLFVVETPRLVAASNALEALLALPGVPADEDERHLAEFLRTGSPVSPWRSARRAVARVPASHACAWGRTGGAARRRHWRFPEPAPRAVRDPREATEGFRAVLADAVRDRLRVPAASIQLSGGLDSPALAATARRALPTLGLHALTVSHARVLPTDESTWAARAAAHLSLPHVVVEAGVHEALAHLDLAGLRTAEPVADAELAAWRARARELAAFGPVTLDGEDGDSLLAPPDLLTLLRTRPWTETFAAWRAHTRARGRRPWIGLREVGPFARRRRASYWAAPGWMRADVRARHGEAPPDAPPANRVRPVAAWSHQQPVWETLFAVDDPDVTGVPLTVVLPFLDARVIAYVFALPPIPWCQEKTLLREAMRGLLPDDLLARPKTALGGAHEVAVRAWRESGGPARPLAHPMDDLVDERRWRSVLQRGDAEAVLAAWRVFEVARWRAQPGAARA